MARIWTIGFELNSVNSEGMINQSTPTVQGTTVRTGTYALQISSLSSGAAKAISLRLPGAAGDGPYFFRTYFRYATAPTGDNAIIRLTNTDTGSTVAGVRLTSAGALKLFNGGSQVGSTSSALTVNTWYRIEIKYDRTPAGGSEVLELLIDGVSVASSSSLTFSNSILAFGLGGNLQLEAQTTGSWFFDDVAVNDATGSFQTSYPGEGQVLTLHANAAGDNNGFGTEVGGVAGSSNNYTRVSEVTPDDSTTYNASATNGVIDDLSIDNTPAAVGASDTINVVQVTVRRLQETSVVGMATSSVRLKADSAGTVSSSALGSLSTSGIWFNFTYATTTSLSGSFNTAYPLTLYQTPDGGSWSKSLLDSTQIGYTLTSNGSNPMRFTKVWLTFDFTPNAGGGTAVKDIIGSDGLIPHARS